MKKQFVLPFILGSVMGLVSCSSSPYVDPKDACSYYAAISEKNVTGFSYQGPVVLLENRTYDYYRTTEQESLQKALEAFQSGMSTLKDTNKTKTLVDNDTSDPCFCFETAGKSYSIFVDTFGYYFESSEKAELYETSFDFAAKLGNPSSSKRFVSHPDHSSSTATSYGTALEGDEPDIGEISFTLDPILGDGHTASHSEWLVVKDDFGHTLSVTGANSFCYEEGMYVIKEGPTFQSLLDKAETAKKTVTVSVSFPTLSPFSIVYDESFALSKGALLTSLRKMMVLAKATPTSAFSVFADAKKETEYEGSVLNEDLTLFGTI